MTKTRPKSVRRFVDRAAAAGLTVEPVLHEASTRTAEEAAQQCGCAVGQIVKSLLFRGAASGRPVLVLVAGDRRLDQRAAAKDVGEPLDRPDAAYVREVTGYAIGGVPPLGHDQPATTFIDPELMAHETVWAAAGAPTAVFEVAPQDLLRATGGALLTR